MAAVIQPDNFAAALAFANKIAHNRREILVQFCGMGGTIGRCEAEQRRLRQIGVGDGEGLEKVRLHLQQAANAVGRTARQCNRPPPARPRMRRGVRQMIRPTRFRFGSGLIRRRRFGPRPAYRRNGQCCPARRLRLHLRRGDDKCLLFGSVWSGSEVDWGTAVACGASWKGAASGDGL